MSRVERLMATLALCILTATACHRQDPGAAEATLKADLKTLRKAIDDFYVEHGRYPESLHTLVETGYLSAIPPDPFTRRPDWQLVRDTDGRYEGIIDVQSAATGLSRDGLPYSEW